MMAQRRLAEELRHIVLTYLCQNNAHLDIDRCPASPHVFAKGSTEPLCTVRLAHGHLYNIEFVCRYWAYKLAALPQSFNPVFIFANNGATTTLKCFVCQPRDLIGQFGQQLELQCDVYLAKNTSVALTCEDFLKFRSNIVFTKDLDIFNSMVVCRAYLMSTQPALQFMVVKPRNPRRVSSLLHELCGALRPNPIMQSESLKVSAEMKNAAELTSGVCSSHKWQVLSTLLAKKPSWSQTIRCMRFAILSLMLFLGGMMMATVWWKYAE